MTDRVNEAHALERRDVDISNGVLTVRKTKNGQDRCLPIQQCVVERLKSYVALRDRIVDTKSATFFIKENGTPAGDCGARYNFAQIGRNIGLRAPQKYNRHGSALEFMTFDIVLQSILFWIGSATDVTSSGRCTNYLCISATHAQNTPTGTLKPFLN